MGSFFLLLAGHALCDFALQTEWIAKNKNRHAGPPAGYSPTLHGPVQTIWPYVLSAHALMHGGAAMLATGSVVVGALEASAHWLIDFAKCERWIDIHADQALHVGCKALWFALIAGGVLS